MHKQAYGFMLMDLHMRALDGLETCAAIRRKRPAGRQPKVIGVTAAGTSEDRACYTAAGAEAAERAQPEQAVDGAPPFNEQALEQIRELGAANERPLLAEMLAHFLSCVPATRESLRAAFEAEDRDAIVWHVHRLKNSAGTLGAQRLLEICGQVEGQARSQNGCRRPIEGAALLAELEHVRLWAGELLEAEGGCPQVQIAWAVVG